VKGRQSESSMLKKLLRSPFTALFDEAQLLPEIRRSILFMIMGNMCGNLFNVIAAGTALTGLAGKLGANDFLFGVLTAIPFFGTLLQIPAAILVSRTKKRKKYMLTFGTLSRALWILMGLVPWIVPMQPAWLRIWTVIFLVGVSSVGGSFINVCFTPWMADLVPVTIRGRWMSLRERIGSVLAVSMGLLSAYLLDTLPGYSGYALVFVLGGTFGVLDMFCFIGVKNVPMKTASDVSLSSVLRQMHMDKPFFRFLLFWTLWSLSSNMANPFFARFALGPLQLSFMQITLAGQVTASVATVLFIPRWGRLMDRYGYKPIMWAACLVTASAPAIWLFSTPGSALTMFLFNAVGASFWCAVNLGALNTLLALSPAQHRPSYIAVFSAVTSIAGAFTGVLLGGMLLQGIQDYVAYNKVTVFGAVPDHYRIVFVLAMGLRIATVLVFLPKIENNKAATFADMRRDFFNRLIGGR
jgi:MFS family permease